jgi:hypothetical protein
MLCFVAQQIEQARLGLARSHADVWAFAGTQVLGRRASIWATRGLVGREVPKPLRLCLRPHQQLPPPQTQGAAGVARQSGGIPEPVGRVHAMVIDDLHAGGARRLARQPGPEVQRLQRRGGSALVREWVCAGQQRERSVPAAPATFIVSLW